MNACYAYMLYLQTNLKKQNTHTHTHTENDATNSLKFSAVEKLSSSLKPCIILPHKTKQKKQKTKPKKKKKMNVF